MRLMFDQIELAVGVWKQHAHTGTHTQTLHTLHTKNTQQIFNYSVIADNRKCTARTAPHRASHQLQFGTHFTGYCALKLYEMNCLM